MSKPTVKEGDIIRVFEETRTGNTIEHLCTVQDVLASQLRATYEYALPRDMGWRERSMWVMFTNLQWDIRKQEWQGTAS